MLWGQHLRHKCLRSNPQSPAPGTQRSQLGVVLLSPASPKGIFPFREDNTRPVSVYSDLTVTMRVTKQQETSLVDRITVHGVSPHRKHCYKNKLMGVEDRNSLLLRKYCIPRKVKSPVR